MVAVPTMDELIALIGLPVNDSAVRSFLGRHRPRRQPPTDRWERILADEAAGYEVTYKRGRFGKPSRVLWAYVYIEPWRGFAGFRGPLSGGLVATDGPVEVAAKLGPPTSFGVDSAGEYRWERRDTALVCVHFAYNRECSRIRLFWLMSPDMAPNWSPSGSAPDPEGT